MYMKNNSDFRIEFNECDNTRLKWVSIGTWSVQDVSILAGCLILRTSNDGVRNIIINRLSKLSVTPSKRNKLLGQVRSINLWYWITGGNSFWNGNGADVLSDQVDADYKSRGKLKEDEFIYIDEDKTLEKVKRAFSDDVKKIINNSRNYAELYVKLNVLANRIQELIMAQEYIHVVID